MMEQINRRTFLHRTVSAGLAISTSSILPTLLNAENKMSSLAVVRNGSPAEMVRKAVEALGGMAQFVKKGQTVLLKPNIGWDRLPEQAANTNPEAVAEVVKMCLEAGAKRVRVLDRTCNEPRRCYARSGIEAAAKSAGAEVRHIVDARFKDVAIPDGELIKSWPFYRDVMDSDVFINIPIVKDHAISGATLGFKNIMGVIGGDRGSIHNKFATKIVDINMPYRPALTILDGYRVLMRNGPTGGNLADVAEKKIVIAGVDMVAADTYALQLLNVNPRQAEYLSIAEKRGMGTTDLSQVKMIEINLQG
ncbi:DUF362 domain-containing protein [candidate division KSB1 bacterium]|nr:DUF362 domain-containing protein [candidate division KSB1 bacterium]